MNREQMIEAARKAIEAIHGTNGSNCGYDCCYEDWTSNAQAVVDAILPQVTTVAELEALPVGAKLLGPTGETWARTGRPTIPWSGTGGGFGSSTADFQEITERFLSYERPLTVIWTPEVTS